MNLSGISFDVSLVLAMGLIVVSAWAALWAVRRVIALAADSKSASKPVRKRASIDAHSWQKGYDDAFAGRAYSSGGADGLAYSSGRVEGEAARIKQRRHST